MKKISLYIIMFLAACLVACTEDFNENTVAPQSYTEEEPQIVNGFTIALDGDFTSPVVLEGLEKNALIQVVEITDTPEIKEGASLTFSFQLSDTREFEKVTDLRSQSENNAAAVYVSDLSEAVKELFGKVPDPRSIYLRVYIYILEGTSASQIPGSAIFNITVTPAPPDIEPAYYLIGTPNDWNVKDVSTLKPFKHSERDVTEDPYFTFSTYSNGELYWKVVPQSVVTAVANGEEEDVSYGLLGTKKDYDDSLEGLLDENFDGIVKIVHTGWVSITLNMRKLTYTIEAGNADIESAYYLIGDVNGWNWKNIDAYQFIRNEDDPAIFTIVTTFSTGGNFKIVPQSVRGTEYNWDALLGNTDSDGFAGKIGYLSAGGGAMRVERAGQVTITLKMRELTYTVEVGVTDEKELQLYVPGSHQGETEAWNPATAPIVYSQGGTDRYEGYVYMDISLCEEQDKGFKFTSEPNWEGTTYGKGGAEGELSIPGDNLTVPETGFYRLVADLSGNPLTYTATKTDWTLVTGTPGADDWGDLPLTLNTATGEWTGTADLTGGKEYKFRANNDWDINLGGDLTNLSYNGANLFIPAGTGTYDITLKLGDPKAYTATVVKK